MLMMSSLLLKCVILPHPFSPSVNFPALDKSIEPSELQNIIIYPWLALCSKGSRRVR